MMTVGHLDAAFDVRSKAMEVSFDPASQQQYLSFHLLLQVPIPQLLQELLSFQRRDGLPASFTTSQEGGFAQRHAPQTQWEQPGQAANAVRHVTLPPAPAVVAEPGKHGRPLTDPIPKETSTALVRAALTGPAPGLAVPAPMARGQGTVQALGNSAGPQKSPPTISPSEKIVQAVLRGDIAAASEAIRQGADVSRPIAGPRQHTLLHVALEAGGRIDMVSLLIQARCNVDTPAADGKTPLHVAISQHAALSPMVARLLLSARANMMLPDTTNMTPLDCARVIVKQAVNRSNPSVRQLLDEVSERPTLAVTVVEHEQVLGACFADMENDKVVFYTELAIGLYSLSLRRILWKQKLTQLRVQAVVRAMTVNPEVGMIAVFLEVTGTGRVDSHAVQNLIIVWPAGQLQEEEPLKLNVESAGVDGEAAPPAILSSTSKARVAILSRICSGKVLCWRLNSSCSQLISEFTISEEGGTIAISDDGRWLSVVGRGPANSRQVEVWTFQHLNGRLRRAPQRILGIDRRPDYMAMISQATQSSCLLAIAEAVPAGGPPSPIEVLSIEVNGSMSSAYRVRPESPCRMLAFCYESPDFLLSGHNDGLVIVYNLPRGQLRLSHDDLGIRSACISADGKLIVTTVRDCFRVYRVSEEVK
eukprot:CAMPEP_0179209552 /NCGR_PEP_ID=MMETSP0796-20121207/104511_1 /TAXON_ID=73915 /ORGANISM="Pyrodinium bahamense, Strain pbaha01" /LENGTH=645 /DNA_ID=CAMNT_0020914511 /DNA_START=36 /DNA_END=1973 /DNA_ORIENTATION=+